MEMVYTSYFTNADEVADNIHEKLSGIGQTTLTDTSFVHL